ncbi:hypothetical protein EDD22DRAFT_982278 [Suillus occidentalis]|nr:hypothetical protein EDD22DRAFT_982278 [Suillus occidentalis]
MCNPQNDVEMRDYHELGDQDDDHLRNQDGSNVDEAELDEIEVLQHKAGSPSHASAGLSHQAKCNDCRDPILIVEKHPEAGQYHPFLDESDYEIARWAIEQGPSQNALTDFLSIDKVTNKLGLSYKNARALHQKIDHELPGVTLWRCSLWAYPAYFEHLTYVPKHRFADEEKSKCIYDELISGDWTLLPDGTTLVPLCQFQGDKTAYPVYLTIGNILKSIHHKPSFRAQKLIGYLPTVSLDGKDLSTDNACLIHVQLFHYAMGVITSSLHAISPTDGIELTSRDEVVCLEFPVVAAYVADYPEQALCSVLKDELGEHLTCTIHCTTLKDHSLNLFPGPFFIGLWLRTLIGDAKLDAHFKHMPHAHGVSGPEHCKICKQLLGCIADAPGAPAGSHTEATLGYLADDVFINLGPCNIEDFNFAKLHSLEHYVDSIWRFGTTDNYNTKATEHLHIDFAKDAYKVTNKKEFWEQMTRWLELLPPGVYLAKNSSTHVVSFRVLEDQFGAAHFKNSLGEFIMNQLQPTAYRQRVAHNVNILQGLEGVDVWYHVKFAVPNLQVDTKSTVLHTAHVEPKRSRYSGKGELDVWFDTVLVNESEHEETGIEVTQLKVIFHIPDEHLMKMGVTRQIGHLTYIEWFSQPQNKDPNSGMYPIS